MARPVLNTGRRRSRNFCHTRNVMARREDTQPLAATVVLAPQLDLLPTLPAPRRICVSLPPSLIRRLDQGRGKLTRSHVVKCAVEALLDGVDMMNRERLLEMPGSAMKGEAPSR